MPVDYYADGSPIVKNDDDPLGNLGFEFGETGVDAAPEGWEFHGGTAGQAGVFWDDVPPSSDYGSSRSFGSPRHQHPVTGDPMGIWRLRKVYRVPDADSVTELSVSGMARITGGVPSDTTLSSYQTFVSEDDAFVELRCYDGSSRLLQGVSQRYSRTARTQLFTRTGREDGTSDEWVPFNHTTNLASGTEYIEVDLVACDGNDQKLTRGSTGSGNAAVLFDDIKIRYPLGLVDITGMGELARGSLPYIRSDETVTFSHSVNFSTSNDGFIVEIDNGASGSVSANGLRIDSSSEAGGDDTPLSVELKGNQMFGVTGSGVYVSADSTGGNVFFGGDSDSGQVRLYRSGGELWVENSSGSTTQLS